MPSSAEQQLSPDLRQSANPSLPLSPSLPQPDELGGWAAMFAIGVRVPGVFPLTERYPDGTYTLWLHDTAVTSWATADWEPGRAEFEVVQSGPRRLWDEVEAGWRWWDARGRPGVERFALTVAPDGAHAVRLA
ncbi:hypothetical protein ACFYST_10865 [Kitasatospora sp. NPDC004614]|uniref:hypothetical protein n=1 Tax=unclassified Kitasatospora TaxID=2633591 RepID=UPI0036CE76AE